MRPVSRWLSSLAELSLLAVTVLLSVWTGLALGLWSVGVLATWCLAFSCVCVSRVPLWEKAVAGLLMPCWLIVSQFAEVSTCDSGSANVDGHRFVIPETCQRLSGSPTAMPLLWALTVLVSIAILTRQVLAPIWSKPVG